jgi:DNA-directed RNA polymerase subunit beta'
LKENVIVGRLIPAGTGSYMNKVRQVAQDRDQEAMDAIAARRAEEAEVPALEAVEDEGEQPGAA